MTELERPRDVGEILRDAFLLWRGRAGTFALIACVVVVPVEIVIFGVGLGQISAGYKTDTSTQMLALETGVSWLLTTPLLTAMTIRALVEPEKSAREAITRGMELFVPALVVTVAVTVAAAGGLLLFVVPGIFLAVRLALVVDAVAIDGFRGMGALRRSWGLTDGNFWRVLGISVGIYLLAAVANQLILLPFIEGARAADRQVIVLAGTIVGQVITLPVTVVASALLYFDLRARHQA